MTDIPCKRCAVYARKSTDFGMKQTFTSIDAQIESCKRHIEAHAAEGWLLQEVYSDVAISGGTMERPAMQKMLADIRAGRIDAIVTYKLDRISRSIRDFSNLLYELEELGVSLVIITQNFDTSTPMGKLCINFLSSFAEFEREMTRDRIRDKAASLAQQGLWNAGRPPFGYRLDEQRFLHQEPAEAAAVRRMFLDAAAGVPLHETACYLNASHAPKPRTRSGQDAPRPWSGDKIKAVLRRRLYAGVTTSHGTEYPGRHEAIVSNEEWQAAQAALKLSLRQEKPARGLSYPLRGLLRCPVCGSPLAGTFSAGRRGNISRYYICYVHKKHKERCSFSGLPAAAVEQAVARQLSALAHDKDMLAVLQRKLPQLERRDIAEALQNVDLLAGRLSDDALGTLFHAIYQSIVYDPETQLLHLNRYIS